ncbi:MAG: hypothetical protein K9L64_03800 [Candidatus Izimaplasma sp.]|nr:hypothetical protein [Candidatus Izimaplasma bacterium]
MKKRFTLAPIFTDNMIFQANKPIKIYGKCKKNSEIKVNFLDQEKMIKTDTTSFLIELEPEDYRNKAFSFSVSSKKYSVTIYNVLIGDVFLFLGGGNVKQTLHESSNIEDYKNQEMRIMDLTNSDRWLISSRDNFSDISSIAYLFVKFLHKKLKKPVGIVTYSHLNENIFTWSDKASILNNKEMYNYLNILASKKEYFLANDFKYLQKNLFNFGFKAINFYQGENDFLHYHFYEVAFRLLIKAYRLEFKDRLLPFNVIQISSLEDNSNYIAASEIRIAQSNLYSEKNQVNVISVVDINKHNIISKNKTVLAKRLSDLVLEKQYEIGKNNLCPQVFSYKKTANKVYIYINNNYLNLISRSGQNLGFIYSENKVDYLPVKNIEINSNQITIEINQGIKEIRYAYENNPKCDIYSSNGLPLLPFSLNIH